MKISEAHQLIEQCSERMRMQSGEVVFDEWAVIALTSTGAKLVAYIGPRIEQFRLRFKADSRPLQTEMEGRQLAVGDFAFVADAVGTAYDACVRIGPASYLWCNHTSSTMAEIRESGAWLPAQATFAAMCERFGSEPVVVGEE